MKQNRTWQEVFAEDLQRVQQKVIRDQREYNNLCMIWEEATRARRIEMLPDLTPEQISIPDYPTAEGQARINRLMRARNKEVRPNRITETVKSPIIRDYKNYVVLARNDADFAAKCKRIDKGDTKGFYPVSARNNINFIETNK